MGFLGQILTSRKVGAPFNRDTLEFELTPSIVRTTRAQIIHLKNDYKDLLNTLEKYLHEHFASIQDADDVAPASANRTEMLGDSIPATLEEPFAKVNSVVAGSPAESAGLKPGDEIRNFGYVNRGNHDGLKKVAECVQGNEGVS